MKKIIYIFFSAMIINPLVVMATPESIDSATVTLLRPYLNGSIYVHLDSNILCDTNVFLIGGGNEGKEVMYSAALAALMSKKKIIVEALTSTGCTGWGTKLQSLYLLAD